MSRVKQRTGANARPRTSGCVVAALLLDGQPTGPEGWPLSGNVLLLNVVASLQQAATAAATGRPGAGERGEE